MSLLLLFGGEGTPPTPGGNTGFLLLLKVGAALVVGFVVSLADRIVNGR